MLPILWVNGGLDRSWGLAIQRPVAGPGVVWMTYVATDSGTTSQCLQTGSNTFAWVDRPSAVNYAAQLTWYVAAITGSDSNDGATPATALKTPEEFVRRIGTPENAGYTVWLLENDASDHTLIIDGGQTVQTPTYVQYQGVAKTPLLTGTLSATQAVNPATKQESTITDLNVADWTPYINHVIQFSGGGRAIVMTNMGAHKASVSQPQLWPFDGTPVVVAPGETYQVLDLVTMSGQWTVAGTCEQDVQEIRFTAANHSFECLGESFGESCVFDGMDAAQNGFLQLYGCCAVSNARAENNGATLTLLGGCASGILARTGGVVFCTNTTAHFYEIDMCGQILGGIGTGYIAALNGGGATGISVNAGGAFMPAAGGAVPVWGKGFTGPGCQVFSGGKFVYTAGSVPSITTSGTELIVGGTNTTFAAVNGTGGLLNATKGALVAPLA